MQAILCYDAACPFCRTCVLRLMPLLRLWRIRPRALQAADIRRRIGLDPVGDVGDECRFITTSGQVLGGGDVVAACLDHGGRRWLARFLRAAWPRQVLRWAYREVARRWHCGETCHLPHHHARSGIGDLLNQGQRGPHRHGWD